MAWTDGLIAFAIVVQVGVSVVGVLVVWRLQDLLRDRFRTRRLAHSTPLEHSTPTGVETWRDDVLALAEMRIRPTDGADQRGVCPWWEENDEREWRDEEARTMRTLRRLRES